MKRQSVQCCAFSVKDYIFWIVFFALAGLVGFSPTGRLSTKKDTVIQFEESYLLVRSALS